MPSENKILEALLQNQTPDQFFKELCLVPMSRIGGNLYQMELALVDILREKMEESKSKTKTKISKKNQKKKNKKK